MAPQIAPDRKKPPTRRPGPRQAPAGVIRADESYHLDEFLARVGWARGALQTARAEGLRVITAGGRCYVLGSDWLTYLEAIAGRHGRSRLNDDSEAIDG